MHSETEELTEVVLAYYGFSFTLCHYTVSDTHYSSHALSGSGILPFPVSQTLKQMKKEI